MLKTMCASSLLLSAGLALPRHDAPSSSTGAVSLVPAQAQTGVDLAICLDEARGNGAKLPVIALIDQFYAEVQQMGGRRWDTSSLLARLEKD